MAKSTRLKVARGHGKTGDVAVPSAARLRALFTAAERKLIASAHGPELAKAARAEVQDWLKRTRVLRDKWRGLFSEQTRTVKRVPPATAEANVRSREKADLLQEAVARLEQRLAELDPGAPKPAAGRAQPIKRARVAAHRTARAGVRADLARQVALLNDAVAVRSPAARPEKRTSAKRVEVKPAAVAAKPAAAASSNRAVGTRRMPRTPITAAVGGGRQAIRFDGSKQRVARTKAKHARIKLKGITTRRGGHVLASGKRTQARRDKRS